jgi:hypothetical protein
MYRISWSAKVTRASSTGSALGGGNGFQIIYTDADDSVVVTTPPSVTRLETPREPRSVEWSL